MVKRISLGVMLSAAAFFLITVTIGTGKCAETISFGLALPLSGAFRVEGNRTLDAYKFWAKKVNSRGGLLIGGKRYPVRLLFYDNRSNPELCEELTEKLITKDGIGLLLGGRNDRLVFAASAAAERQGYPYICAASADRLFSRGFRYLFSTLPRVSDALRGCVEMLRRLKPRPSTVAILGVDDKDSALAYEAFKRFSEKAGFRVAHFELLPPALENYDSALSKVKAKSPEVMLIGAPSSVTRKVLEAMRKIGFRPKAVVVNHIQEETDSSGMEIQKEFFIFAPSEWGASLPFNGLFFGSAREFDRSYHVEYQRHPGSLEAAVVAAALALQTALEESGIQPPFDDEKRGALMKKLHEVDVETFFGKIRFGTDGVNVGHPPFVIQIRKRDIATVFPKRYMEAAPVYPIPAWE